MEAEFGFDEEKQIGERCPGEINCKEFQREAGKDAPREEKLFACHGGTPDEPSCDKYHTKPKPKSETVSNTDARIEQVIHRAYYHRQNRLSGYPSDKSEMTPLEFMMMKYIDEIIERFQRRAERMQRDLTEESVLMMSQLMQISMIPR